VLLFMFNMAAKFYCQDYVSYAHVLSTLITALNTYIVDQDCDGTCLRCFCSSLLSCPRILILGAYAINSTSFSAHEKRRWTGGVERIMIR
jgi:hypothetical protein